MKYIIKRIFCVFIVVTLMVPMSSCYYYYNGDHADLYSVAVNNIFGIKGYKSNGEVPYDPVTHIIETDNYGRILFFYSEYYDDSYEPEIEYAMAFVIMQKSKGRYVYYYQDKCYIPYFDVTDNLESISAKLAPDYFDELKESNDWNKPFDKGKCKKARITDEKPEGELTPDDYIFDDILYEHELKNGYPASDYNPCRFSYYCESDRYGRELHYAYSSFRDKTENDSDDVNCYEYAIIFESDGTCMPGCVVRIPDPSDSYEMIKELKQNSNWDKPK